MSEHEGLSLRFRAVLSSAFDTAVAGDGLTLSSFNFNSTTAQGYGTAAGLTIDGVNFRRQQLQRRLLSKI